METSAEPYTNSPNKDRSLENVVLGKNYNWKGPITP